jgi:hypothetical protein
MKATKGTASDRAVSSTGSPSLERMKTVTIPTA